MRRIRRRLGLPVLCFVFNQRCQETAVVGVVSFTLRSSHTEVSILSLARRPSQVLTAVTQHFFSYCGCGMPPVFLTCGRCPSRAGERLRCARRIYVVACAGLSEQPSYATERPVLNMSDLVMDFRSCPPSDRTRPRSKLRWRTWCGRIRRSS